MKKVMLGVSLYPEQETLEEIDFEYKGKIIKELSDSKAVEVLENMPNDEIAD